MTPIIHQPDSYHDLSAFELFWSDYINQLKQSILRKEKNSMEVVQNWELRARDVKYQIFVFYVGSSILLEFLFHV